MKKIVFFIVFLIMLFSSSSYAVTTNGDICANVDVGSIEKHFPIPLKDLKIRQKRNVENFCQVILSTDIKKRAYIVFYVRDDLVINGRMFKNKKDISLNDLQFVQAQDEVIITQNTREKIPELKKYVFSHLKNYEGESQLALYVIIDPFCHYCKKALEDVEPLLKEYKVALNVILSDTLGMTSRTKAIEAICKKISLEQVKDEKWLKTKPTKEDMCQEGRVFFDASKKVFKEISLSGVPLFLFEDGTRIQGLNMDGIAKEIRKQLLKKKYEKEN